MAAQILDVPEEGWRLRSGLPVLLRPLCASDLALHWGLFKNCSPQSIFQRFFQLPDCSKVTDADVARYVQFDRTRELAIAAVQHPGEQPELGVVRLVDLGGGRAEFAVLVADPWQRQGLGRKLVEKAIDTARHHGLEWLEGYVLPGNRPMLHLCRRLGFEVRLLGGEGLYEVRLRLTGQRPDSRDDGDRLGLP
jgi:acetyltransferase